VTVTPSFVAQEFAKYVVRNSADANAGKGITEQPRFMPPIWSPTFPNCWLQDQKLMCDDPTLQQQLIVRVGVAVNSELIEQLTSTGGGHLESFTEDIESVGSRQNCLLQPQFGYGTLWVRIVNDGTTTNSYTLRLNCTPGIEPLSGSQQTLTYGVNPGETAGLPVSIALLVTISVFLDPTNAGCTVELTPNTYGNLVLDTVTEKCAFSRIFTSIGPIGGGIFANVSAGGLFGNLTGPLETDFCDLFPVICDIFLSPGTATGFSQMMVTMLVMCGLAIFGAFFAAEFGKVMFSSAALKLKQAKLYAKFEKENVPSSLDHSNYDPEERQARLRREFETQQKKLGAIQQQTNSKTVRDSLSSMVKPAFAGNLSGDTITQFAGLYAPDTLNGESTAFSGTSGTVAAEASSAIADFNPFS
jgi:hypothetical protein